MKFIFYISVMLTLTSFHPQPVIVCLPEGDLFTFEANGSDQYFSILEQLQNNYGDSGEVILNFTAGKKKEKKPSEKNQVTKNDEAQSTIQYTEKHPQRYYFVPVAPEEKAIIAKIVNTLGQENTIKIAKSHSYLDKIGEQIRHVHPLRFLMTVFTDEEMKVSIQAIENKTFGTFIWKKFFDTGLRESLEIEAKRQNMKQEFIDDFSAQVGISSSLISPAIHNRQWKQLVSILISSIPRNGNANNLKDF